MTTPPFTRVIWGKIQKLAEWPRGPGRTRRAILWLRRLNRAHQIISCSNARFTARWLPTLNETELGAALKHRADLDLWLDAEMIIYERIEYYSKLV